MSINHAILGLLEWKEMSGYDLKKAIQEIPFMPWSGNNNQIYKALMQLTEKELVQNKTVHQENGPSKKIYKLTKKGKASLAEWVRDTEPEMPEFKKLFLTQLAWAGKADIQIIEALLLKYERELQLRIAMQQEQKRRQCHFPNRSEKETFLWEMLCENLILSYQAELDWINQVREGGRL